MMQELQHLNALRCVEVAARHASYTKAAEELNVTQAAVSQQIRLIESVIGVKLFKRKGHHMLPTTKGQILAKQLSEAFFLMAEAVKKVKKEPREGVLNITTTQSFATMYLMAKLWNFQHEYPGIHVHVNVSSQFEDLIHGEMDCAIRYGFQKWPNLKQTTLFEDDLAALCSPNLTKHVDLSCIKNITQCTLVAPVKDPELEWLSWLEEAGLKVNPKDLKFMLVANTDVALSAVLAGHGIMLTSPKLAQNLLKAGSLVQPFETTLKDSIRYTILSDPSSPKKERIQAFSSWLANQFA